MVKPTGCEPTIMHCCSSYPQYIIHQYEYRLEGTSPGEAVILRDQAEDLYCTGYHYIPHGVPMESGMDEHHWYHASI